MEKKTIQMFVQNGKTRFFINGKEILLIDMDSVMADLCTDWFHLYNKDYNDNLTNDKITTNHVHTHVKQECGKRIYDYLQTPGIFRNLKPIDHSQEVLERLHRNYEIFIVSNPPVGHSHDEFLKDPGKTANPSADKKAWLREHFPFLDPQNVIFTSEKYMVTGSLLLDDSPWNVRLFQQLGRVSVVMDQPYNRNLDFEAPRACGWLDFERQIKSFLPTL